MSEFKKSILANYIGKGWVALMSFAFIPIYIKLIGIESYGFVGIYATLTALLSVFDLGLSSAVTREFARFSMGGKSTYECGTLLRTIEIIYWCVGIVSGICIITAAPMIIRYWINLENITSGIAEKSFYLMGVAFFLQWPCSIYASGLQGLQKQVLQNSILVGFSSLKSIGAIMVLVYVSAGLPAFFIWQIIVSLLQVLVTALCLWRSLPRGRYVFALQSLRRVGRFSAGVGGISFLAVIIGQMDKVMISKLMTMTIFSYYTLASVMASSVLFFATPIVSAYFPRFSQLVSTNNEEKLRSSYHTASQLVSLFMFPVGLIIIFFSYDIILVWTGSLEIAKSTHLSLSLLTISFIFNGVMHIPYALQWAYGWTKLVFYQHLIMIILAVPCIFIFTQMYGIMGAAITWNILNSSSIIIMIPLMHKRLLPHEQKKWYIEDNLMPLIGALSVVVPAYFVLKGILNPTKLVLSLSVLTVVAIFNTAFFTSSIRNRIQKYLYREGDLETK